MGMYRKLLISTSLLACVLGAGVVSSVATDAQYIQQANIAGYNAKADATAGYPSVVDSTTHEVKHTLSSSNIADSADGWNYSKLQTNSETGKNYIDISIPANTLDGLTFEWHYPSPGIASNTDEADFETIMKSESLSGGDSGFSMNKFGVFTSSLAVMKNGDQVYYGNIGYINDSGEFVSTPLYNMFWHADGSNFDYDGGQEIVFRFENIDFTETTNVEVGVVDGMFLQTGEDDAFSSPYSATLGGINGKGLQTWEELNESYASDQVEFISISGKNNAKLNNQTIETDTFYYDPIIADSFEYSNLDYDSVNVTFDSNISNVSGYYQEFNEGSVGDINKNISFYENEKSIPLDATLLSTSTSGDENQIKTYNYELSLDTDEIYNNISVDITFENDEGITNSASEIIPKTRTYDDIFKGEEIVGQYSNPFNLASPSTIWNDENGQIIAHIALNTGDEYLKLDPSKQTIKFRYKNSDGAGTFGDGSINKYEVKFNVSADGTYADLVIVNPYGNDFIAIDELSVSIDTKPLDSSNIIYEYTLKTYTDSIGTKTPINSIEDVSLSPADVLDFTFGVDPVNNSITDTETTLNDMDLIFGYDSKLDNEEYLIDENAKPIYPDTGTELTAINEFTVTEEDGKYSASISLQGTGETKYSDFWIQRDNVFRIYDNSGAIAANEMVNPIVMNSGEVSEEVTVDGKTSVILSFVVNDDGAENKYANYIADSAKFTSSSNVDNVDGVTSEFIGTEVMPLASGQVKISYKIDGLIQGKSYDDIGVTMSYSDVGFVDETPRIILNTFKSEKTNPIVAGSGTIIGDVGEDSATISFQVMNEAEGSDVYVDFDSRTAQFSSDESSIIESDYVSIVDSGEVSIITYKLTDLEPNKNYSNIKVNFNFADGYVAEPTLIYAGPLTTSKVNPIIENSGSIVDIGSDYVEIKFSAYVDPSIYASFNTDEAMFTGGGLTGAEDVSLIGTPGVSGTAKVYTYRISGIKPGTTLSNIYVDYPFDDIKHEPTLILKDTFATEKLNPIIADSGAATDITDSSATISFDVHNDLPGENIYADYYVQTASFKYDGQTSGGKESSRYVETIINSEPNTSTIVYELTNLDPNKDYNNITVSFGYSGNFEEDGPTLILDTFTTKRIDPIIEDSGKVTTVTESDATIQFNVNNNSINDVYGVYDPAKITIANDEGVDWSDSVEYKDSFDNGDGTTRLIYKISGLEANKTYSRITVDFQYDDLEFEPTEILAYFTTSEISKEPIIYNSFVQDFNNTDENSIEFSFDYRIDYLPADPEITSIGYKDELGHVEEFANFNKVSAEAYDDERGTATYKITGLDTNTSYYDVWVSLNGQEPVNAMDQTTGEEFVVRTKGKEPIIANSGAAENVTDTTATLSFNYYDNDVLNNKGGDGDYYSFDPAEVTLGYKEIVENDGESTVTDVPFLKSNVKYTGSKLVSNTDGVIIKKATYELTGLTPATTYENIYVNAHTSDTLKIELQQQIILPEGFKTLGQNPILSDSIEFNNVVPSNGTEAEMSFWFQGVSSMYDEGEYLYSQIDTSQTIIGYESSVQTESDGTKIGKDDSGIFVSEHMGDDTINGVFTKATYKITDLEANTTYTGIYVIVFDAAGNQLSKTYATGDNATFTALPSDALPMTPGEVIMWISIIVLVVLLLIIIIYIAIKYIKKHFALAIFMDAELSVDESEIVFNLINAKHKKKLWQAFEGNLVLYAAGKKIDAIFKRTTELHNGYRIYISEDFTDKEAIFSLLTSTKYNKFSVGIYKDHSRYHVTSVPDHKVAKLASRLDHTDDREYEDVVHSIVENLDDGHIEERLFDSIEGFISGINKRKTTSTSLRYQAIVPHDHSLNHDLFFEENDVSFWHVYDGKLYELKYEFKNRFGSLIEVDIIGLKPGTAYVGLTLSFDKGKTFMPSATVYGITRDEDGKMPNLTNAELAKKPSASAKGVQIWDEQTLVANVGERLAELHKKVITKMHFEDNEENSTKIISLERSTSYFEDYINKWWSESKVEKPKNSAKTTETKVSTKEEPKAKKEESKTKKDDSKAK